MTTALSASSKHNPAAEELFRETLKLYEDSPELDPTTDRKLLDDFERCTSTDYIMLELKKQVDGLKGFKDHHWTRLCEKLKPIVEVLWRLTTIVGDAQSIVQLYTLLPFSRVYNFASHRASLAENPCSRPLVFCWL